MWIFCRLGADVSPAKRPKGRGVRKDGCIRRLATRLARQGISPLERLSFRRRTFHIPNLTHKLLQRILQAV